MESITVMRDRLHDYLNEIDEKKVQALYALFELDEPAYESPLSSKEFIAEMDARMARIKSGESKPLTREESKARIEAIRSKYIS